MYRIKLKDSETLIKTYLETDQFMDKVGELMQYYLTADAWDYNYYADKIVKLKVGEDSPTYRFLNKYSKGNDLKRLLSGDFDVQMEIIKEVYYGMPDDKHTWKEHKKHFELIKDRKSDVPEKKDVIIDDFNSILRHIFEKTVYDGKRVGVVHLDKYTFAENLGLKVCPYCGRSYIYTVKPKQTGKEVKVHPQLDHFLPKSQFPFLALNFYNLIPCCTQCNMAPAKKEQSPMVKVPKPELKVMHPYLFDDKAITFGYDPKSEAPLDASEISVNVDYHDNETFKNGYNDLFFIDTLYAKHNLEAHDLYVRMKTWKSKAEKAYKSIGITEDYWQMLPLLFLGYTLTEDQAPLRPLFKFNKELYEQMCNDFETGKFV